MNKTAVLAAIVAALESEWEAAIREARAASDAATDPDAKAENKYDTRALEASYLARGQAQRVAGLGEAVAQWRLLATSAAAPTAVVVAGAIVTLRTGETDAFYCFGPSGGGTAVTVEGREIWPVTPASPLGRQLSGKRAGAVILLPGLPARTVIAVA